MFLGFTLFSSLIAFHVHFTMMSCQQSKDDVQEPFLNHFGVKTSASANPHFSSHHQIILIIVFGFLGESRSSWYEVLDTISPWFQKKKIPKEVEKWSKISVIQWWWTRELLHFLPWIFGIVSHIFKKNNSTLMKPFKLSPINYLRNDDSYLNLFTY